MNRSKLVIYIVGLALLGLVGGALYKLSSGQKLGRPGLKSEPIPGAAIVNVPLPAQVLDYESKLVPPDAITTNALPADTSFSHRIYSLPDGFQLSLNVVMMGTDRTSLHQPQFCLVGQGWRIDKTERVAVPIAKPHPYALPVMKLTASKEVLIEGQRVPLRALYVYWFVADNALTADHWERMWWMSRELVRTGTLQRWAYVSCLAICRPGDEDATYRRMEQFLGAAVPQFQLASGPQLTTATK
jgi:hypothetical protein